jgi:ATP-dependent exoDNAse (exonuclease V) beta subunit
MLITTHLDLAEGHLEETRLSTIRGFCNELLHERLVEALVDPRFAVVTEPDAEAEYGRAFERWIEGRAWKNPEGLRRALRRRTSLDDGDPVAQLGCAGWTKAGSTTSRFTC